MSSLLKTVKLREYIDDRGVLVENSLENIITQSRHFFISKSKPGAIRGNHFHKKKSEWIYIIQGTCKVYAVDIRTYNREALVIKTEHTIIVNIGINIAHAFQNIGNDEMILLAFVNQVHRDHNPDTYRFHII